MLLKEDIKRIKNICNKLREYGVECNVSIEEFIDYMSSPTYVQDSFSIRDIIDNDYLLMHELIEITILKKLGYRITPNILREAYPDTYLAHLKALEKELEIAYMNGDLEWVRKRLTDLYSYLYDPMLPNTLIDKVKSLLNRFRAIVKTSKK